MNNKKRSIIKIETLIIIAITGCIIFLNNFTTSKLSELENAAMEAMFIKDGLEYNDSEQLAEEIIKYHPDSCKMIEIYDETFNMIFSLQFDEAHKIHNNDINNHPELVKLLTDNHEGQTEITIDKYNEDIYFQWVTNNRDEKRLVIVYSTKPVVEGIWVFSFVCYLILVLMFALLIILHTKNYNEKINQYHKTSIDFRNEVGTK